MVKNSYSQNGSVFTVIIIILVVAIVGVLGFAFWQNITRSGEVASSSKKVQEAINQNREKVCANSTDNVEAGGVFCSEDIGVRFQVPEIFKGKFQKAENYDITEGSMEELKGNGVGKSIANYRAVVTSGEESLSLTVSKEPIRSGYSSIGHALRSTYFNAETRNLYFVEGAKSEYDSTTDTYKVTQQGYAGESIPFFDVDGAKVFYGNIGDAGVIERGYLMVMSNHLVVVKIKHAINPMNEPVIDIDRPFADLDSYLRRTKILK